MDLEFMVGEGWATSNLNRKKYLIIFTNFRWKYEYRQQTTEVLAVPVNSSVVDIT